MDNPIHLAHDLEASRAAHRRTCDLIKQLTSDMIDALSSPTPRVNVGLEKALTIARLCNERRPT